MYYPRYTETTQIIKLPLYHRYYYVPTPYKCLR